MWWWLATVGFADTYLNGTLVDPRSLSGVTLERATVRFDGNGNIHVDAPGYKVQVVPSKTTGSSTSPPNANGIARGRWWVVTEDRGSIGHTVEVLVNGQLVTTSRSGEGDRVFDVGPWLRTGANTVLVRSVSTSPGGGNLTIFVGAGGSDKGVFGMPDPQVEYGVGAKQSGSQQRTFALNVDR